MKIKIKKENIAKMNKMIERGETIASVARQFVYNYNNVYYAVDYSLLGKKRSITSKLKKLQEGLTDEDQISLVEELKELLNEIYVTSKKNGNKLIEISKILAE